MEPEATFVGTKRGVELDPVTTIDLDLAFVVFPRDSKLNHSFRDGGDLKGFPVLWVLVEKGRVFEC